MAQQNKTTEVTEQHTKAQERLIELLDNASKNHEGKTRIWGKVEHVSKSGMSRSIKLFIVVDGNIQDITGYAADALNKKRDNHWGIKVTGCGMDMIHHLIDTVSYRLFKEDLYNRFSYSRL